MLVYTMKSLYTLLFLFLGIFAHAQNVGLIHLRQMVDTLCCPAMKGRGLIHGGAQQAATFIFNRFNTMAVDASIDQAEVYLQPFQLLQLSCLQASSAIEVGEHEYLYGKDFFMLEFKNDVFLPGRDTLGFSIAKDKETLHGVWGKKSFIINKISESMITQLSLIKQDFMNGDELAIYNRQVLLTDTSRVKLNVSDRMYREILKNINRKHPSPVVGNLSRDTSQIMASNIVASLPCKMEMDSIVIIGAHYDHLGKNCNSYFPGANDNASGVAVLLELYRRISMHLHSGGTTRYRLVFTAFSAEEPGLLGSKWFVDHGIIDLSKVKCMINLDMVGGIGTKLENDQLYLLHNQTPLGVSVAAAAPHYPGIRLLPVQDSKYLKMSDCEPFMEKGLPVLFFFSGVDAHLHQPTDLPEHLNFTKMEALVDLLVGVLTGDDMP